MLTLPQSREVHLWRLELDEEQARPEILSEDEIVRAGRFRFERDAGQWMTGRTLLRLMLGRYLGGDPKNFKFETGPWGKPGLPGCSLRFNVTHSGAAALLAFAWEQEVGVDMERVRGDLEPEIAAHVFSLPEQAWLREQAREQYPAAFLTLWTAKEAYVKATGRGLSFPLERLTLLPITGTTGFRASPCVSPLPVSLRRVDVGPDYLAALALEGSLDTVRYFDFHSPFATSHAAN